MHVKAEYIDTVLDAIDFISRNTESADKENDQAELKSALHEIVDAMRKSRHQKRVSYYVSKGKEKLKKQKQ